MMISFIKWKKAVQAYLSRVNDLLSQEKISRSSPESTVGQINLRSSTHDTGPYSFMPLFNRNQSKTQKQFVTN